jgi:hypothetical protein
MKKLFISLFFVFISVVQGAFSQCDLDFDYINTGSNMTVFFTPTVASDMITEMGEGTVGAFFLSDDNTYFCTSSGSIIGDQTSLAVMGDDATTDNQDGFNANQEMLWYYESNNGTIYSLVLSPADVYVINGMSFISSYTATVEDCESEDVTGCTDLTACNYNEFATVNEDSCTYAETNLDCDGNCLNDSDTDGVCDENEIVGCADASALNFDPLATDSDNTLCEFPVPFEGCTDPAANNYNELANIEDGSCLYGIDGCTYPEASNYNMEATNEDESCVFDSPFIYITSPIDGDLLTNTTVSVSYEVVNTIISSDLLAGHIKYSVDGGAFGSTFNQTGEIVQDFGFGEHSIQFIIYDNVSGNNQPFSPSIETTINFTVGEEGCTNPLAGNYNLNAIIDDGNCVPNADFGFDNTNTGSNHTLIVLMSQFGAINVNGLLSQPGDLLGVFYANDGLYYGGGYDTINDDNIQIAAWGDDATTDEVVDGFIEGQPFVWAIQFAETGNSVYLEAIYGVGSDTYTSNGISSIIGFEVMEFYNIEGCINPDYLEYNPFAVIDDNSCETLKIYGCTENTFLEYWAYDSVSLSIQLPDVIANTNDGSCVTSIIEGCTNSDYIEYCTDCNVSNNTQCSILVIPGCTDPLALNYDPLANSNNGTCEFNLCINLEVTNFEIITSSTLDIPVLSYDIINSSTEEISLPMITLYLDTEEYFEISMSVIATGQINPGDTVHVEGIITNDISMLPDYVFIGGYVLIEGQSFDSGDISCDLAFTEELISTIHLGCTIPSAYNFDSLATVNDYSCIDSVQTYTSIFHPNCSDHYGSSTLFVTGGIPPYTSPSFYTHYSELGIPELLEVVVGSNGTVNMTGLVAGTYTVEIHDSSYIIETFEFTVITPDEVIVDADINSSNLLTSSLVQGNAIFYQWLYEGESIEGSNSSSHYADEVGDYQVYVENINGCGAYSENVYLNTVGINEFDKTSFSLYPNPVHSTLNIRLSQLATNSTISITDVLGQEILKLNIDTRTNADNMKINMSDLPNGMYFVVVENNAKQIVKRFIKN